LESLFLLCLFVSDFPPCGLRLSSRKQGSPFSRSSIRMASRFFFPPSFTAAFMRFPPSLGTGRSYFLFAGAAHLPLRGGRGGSLSPDPRFCKPPSFPRAWIFQRVPPFISPLSLGAAQSFSPARKFGRLLHSCKQCTFFCSEPPSGRVEHLNGFFLLTAKLFLGTTLFPWANPSPSPPRKEASIFPSRLSLAYPYTRSVVKSSGRSLSPVPASP